MSQLPIPSRISFKTNINQPDLRFNQPFFLDMETCEILMFQTVPAELEYNPETQWNVVATNGRNNPLYQYNGAEDTLNFTLSWYANEDSRQDVLRKIKWVEALGKNDGYDNKPHRVKFIMGDLYNEAIWILFSMPVRMSMFNRTFDMMPCLATQEITLKRISTDNRKSYTIRKLDT